MFQISVDFTQELLQLSSSTAPHANWLLSFLHVHSPVSVVCSCSYKYTPVSAIWRRTSRQLIYSRAMLKGRAAWRTPAPELINFPNQYVMGSEEGSAGTFETFERESCKYATSLNLLLFNSCDTNHFTFEPQR